MQAFVFGRCHCDGCGKLRQCLLVRAFSDVYKLCATCVHNAARWKQRNTRAVLRTLKARHPAEPQEEQKR